MLTKLHILVFSVAVLYCATADAQTIAHLFGFCLEDNESWNICGTSCEKTCANPSGSGFLCPQPICLRFVTSGCRCNPGYVRNTENNACVSVANCP